MSSQRRADGSAAKARIGHDRPTANPPDAISRPFRKSLLDIPGARKRDLFGDPASLLAPNVHRSNIQSDKRRGTIPVRRRTDRTASTQSDFVSKRRSKPWAPFWPPLLVARGGFPPNLGKSDLFRQLGSLCRVVRRDHGIVGRQVPFLAILRWRHAEGRQMTP